MLVASPSCLRSLLGRSQTAQRELRLPFPLCEGLVSSDVAPKWGTGQGDGGGEARVGGDRSGFGVTQTRD